MNNVMIAVMCICFISLIFCALMGIRNHLISKIRLQALAVVSKRAKKAIKDGDGVWERFYDEWESKGSYNSMLFSLTKWKYEDFYDDL